ncbi:MAG: YqgE/AlgH family protein [Flavobacteriaceae bacterium]|nr:YqgE/AlgH family protein [Flavobacteriaceae bacterium]
MLSLKPTKGKLLVADPSIWNDSSFNRSIVLLSEHNDEGAVGFIMNKPSIYTISDLIPEIDSNLRIYNGGPVSKENLYFVHRIPEMIPDSIEIGDGIFWGGDFDTVQQLLDDGILSADDIRFFLGYSGWSKDQLNDELETTSWKVIENNHKNIFGIHYKSFWKDELMKFGGEYQLWANAPENPSLN